MQQSQESKPPWSAVPQDNAVTHPVPLPLPSLVHTSLCVQLASIRAAIDLVKEQGNYIQSDEACTSLMRGYSE